MSATPSPPRGTGPAGKALFRRIVADVDESLELDARDLGILDRAARLADRIAELDRAVTSKGVMIAGRAGARLNPAVSELRQSEQALARLLGLIDMEADAVSQTAKSRRASSRAGPLGWRRPVTTQSERSMTRLRAQPAPEPSAVNAAVSAHRFRDLRRWVQLVEHGLSEDRIGQLVRGGSLPRA